MYFSLSNTSLFIKKVCRYARKRLLTQSKSGNDGSMASEEHSSLVHHVFTPGLRCRFIHSSHSMGYAVKSNLCCCLCIHTTISLCHANNFSVKSVLKQIRLEPLFNERLWFCHHLLYACISTVQNKTKQKHICNNFGFVQCFLNLCVNVKVYLKSERHFWFLRGFKALKWTRKWANTAWILPAHLMAIWTVAQRIFLFTTWLCSRAKLCFFISFSLCLLFPQNSLTLVSYSLNLVVITVQAEAARPAVCLCLFTAFRDSFFQVTMCVFVTFHCVFFP